MSFEEQLCQNPTHSRDVPENEQMLHSELIALAQEEVTAYERHQKAPYAFDRQERVFKEYQKLMFDINKKEEYFLNEKQQRCLVDNFKATKLSITFLNVITAKGEAQISELKNKPLTTIEEEKEGKKKKEKRVSQISGERQQLDKAEEEIIKKQLKVNNLEEILQHKFHSSNHNLIDNADHLTEWNKELLKKLKETTDINTRLQSVITRYHKRIEALREQISVMATDKQKQEKQIISLVNELETLKLNKNTDTTTNLEQIKSAEDQEGNTMKG
ncbi:MAG: hypothetical protein M1827_006123 [Pycnora praestabilis]|nr:MAG: hypothetical protein M1827_006123 [Pycnora praestabilis]